MMNAWGAFVRDGVPVAPTASGAASWPVFQASGLRLRLDTPPSLGPPVPAACGFWAGGR